MCCYMLSLFMSKPFDSEIPEALVSCMLDAGLGTIQRSPAASLQEGSENIKTESS